MKKILVIGSLNMDFSIDVDKIPTPGETVNANSLIITPGGKGANQAYTIGKLEGNVQMLGMIGTDSYGQMLIDSLRNVNVDISNIYQSSQSETGKAFIYVDPAGENSIAIVHGTNYLVTKDFILNNKKLIEEADIILIQLEIPIESIDTILQIAKDKIILLDPAPANKDILNLDLSNIYLIKPNETELQVLTNMPTDSFEQIVCAANTLIKKGIKNVLVSLSDKGSLLISEKEALHFGPIPSNAIDTTAAGDSFIASIALMLSQEKSLHDAIKFATKVASIVVSRKGAQASIPNLKEVI